MFRLIKLVVLTIFIGLARSELPFFLNCPLEICSKLEKSVCENFYELTCSKWLTSSIKPKYEPIWNKHIQLNYKNYERLIHILENENDEVLEKPQKFYKACINVEENDTKYWKNLKLLIELLKGWPITKTVWLHQNNYDWLEELVQIHRLLQVQPILKFSVNVDYKNTSIFTLYIEPGNLIFPHHILNNSNLYQSELKVYEEWILNTLHHLYGKNDGYVMEKVRKIVNFEQKLANIQRNSNLYRTTINKLHKQFPANWLLIFNKLFVNITEIQPNQTIIIRNIFYFRQLYKLLQQTDKRVIANYFMWNVLKELSRDTTNYMRNLSFLVDKALLGVEADLPRTVECVMDVNKYFSWALVPSYMKLYVNKATLEDVQEMTNNIQEEFLHLLAKTTWLSRKTVHLIVDKIKNVRKFIGFPKWVENRTLLNDYYKTLIITDNHLLNVLKVESFQVEQDLIKINKVVEKAIWPSQIFEANAYYNILQNSIFIPLGILDMPFYHANQSKSFNYGALGSLIGHEFSHALDTTGRQANKNGIIGKWWPQNDINNYQKRIACFQLASNNGLVGENIADSIGITISYQAFINNNYSQDGRNFFIGFAQMWCEKGQQIDIFNDEHGVSKNRVMNTLNNNSHFIKQYNCNNNTENVCNLW